MNSALENSKMPKNLLGKHRDYLLLSLLLKNSSFSECSSPEFYLVTLNSMATLGYVFYEVSNLQHEIIAM